jgi:hypothetical protein
VSMQFLCNDEERRAAVLASALNGIDYLEVIDRDAPEDSMRQRLLIVRALRPVAPLLTENNVLILGGVRVTPVRTDWAMMLGEVAGAPDTVVPPLQKAAIALHFAAESQPDHVFLVFTSAEGDYSTYTLKLVNPADAGQPAPGFDPRSSAVAFSFKVECPSEFDCKVVEVCPPEKRDEPRLSYLAKDYASFRRVMLDRLSAIAPGWRERSPADAGIALVELLAYVGDRLSYFQDAVATEAYLGTARRRVSIRRHARLVDYRMHEGVNARSFVFLDVGATANGASIPAGTVFSTSGNERIARRLPDEVDDVLREGGIFFESLHEVTVHQNLNRLPFYTWSDRECCLPAGATRATLQSGPVPGLDEGSFLLFEEVRGPATGAAADADPLRRHIVRLTALTASTDPVDGTPILEIEWGQADALPFAICVSATTDDEHGGQYVGEVSLARGNLVLVDHGLSIADEYLGNVDADPRYYRPALTQMPVTHAASLPRDFPAETPALSVHDLLQYVPRDGLPEVRLDSADGEEWEPVRDLLASDRFQREFVLEVDQEHVSVRFGDDVNGMQPEPGLAFNASYRLGNGREGNVGADAIRQVFTNQTGIADVRNPLAATGGVDPESMEEVRRYAPQAFREQQRAVTEADYAWAAEKHPEVNKAAATFRWTGSWYTVFVTVDRRYGQPVDADFEISVREHLSLYRMAGYDLEIDAPRFVPLEIQLLICVERDYQRSTVKQELLRVLGNKVLADGRTGFFHPDRWTFAQSVYLSQLIAAAKEVTGVASVEALTFKRWDRDADGELDAGVLDTERLEIPRLDNDPNFQERGLLTLQMGGGR